MTTPISTSFGVSAETKAAAAANKDSSALDKDAFMKLMIAQLRNQDPSSPMDTSAMMAQTTQMTTMEKLVELSDTQRESFALQMRMAAASLVGQQVTWTDDAGADRTGNVASVSYAGPVPTVKVGDQEIALDAVSSVATSSVNAPALLPA
ncbi:flagellar hook assembly protein FlgD [Cellulomonas sp. URHE0023]|uniref:flagellar hook assembly protein FlgD n=1 Tax=Cellulomonas sp. URHE0023 TaxID=1380354 RepID=UPI0004819CE4|nr:flagellar hook capping FlgD N-terminal domain-containing protein [Cellulomonas sp. URHE0023]